MNPLVAIIIVNWNGKQVTSECLQSLRTVDYSPFKIYVVDNASSDGSVEEIVQSFSEVCLIRSNENRFYAGGNNYGFQIAMQDKPEFVLFLNNDTVVDKDFLKYLVSAISYDEKIGMVGPKIYHYDQPDVIWSAGGFVSFFRGKTGHYGLRRKDNRRFDRQREVGYLTGCAQMIRAELFQKLGGFDEIYHMYSEDADLCQRARNAGYKIVYVPDAHIWHKISSSSGGGLTTYKIRNKIR
ncbi:MAG: glycosyltransferase family 2 protein, partial [Candidatus Marinimicrobia bacterium]|nr:glycosyltransferase family 2 protein [Candidatus Neomarinimicrobiota bacterium]